MKAAAYTVALAAALTATAASAHHSGAMFDRSKEVTLSGVVKDWQWTNPHTWLLLDVVNEKGLTVEWGLEGQDRKSVV